MYFIFLGLTSIGGGIACVIGCRLNAKRRQFPTPKVISLLPHIIVSAICAGMFFSVLCHLVVLNEINKVAMQSVNEKRELTQEELIHLQSLGQWWVGNALSGSLTKNSTGKPQPV